MEGFFCPICRREMPDSDALMRHYDQEHSDTSRSKGILASLFGRRGHEAAGGGMGESHGAAGVAEEVYWEPQTLGRYPVVRTVLKWEKPWCKESFGQEREDVIVAGAPCGYRV